MFSLRATSPAAWIAAVLANLDQFLVDHAAAEKKASGMAVSMLSHYPDRPVLVNAMADLAIEEMMHFREVVKLLYARGLQPGADDRDPYVNQMRALHRKGSDVYLLDRLLVAGVIEARGHERFGLLADALPTGDLKSFYAGIARSEARHKDLFVELALEYFPDAQVWARLEEVLEAEARIMLDLPVRAALH